jgi:hypothetical protein
MRYWLEARDRLQRNAGSVERALRPEETGSLGGQSPAKLVYGLDARPWRKRLLHGFRRAQRAAMIEPASGHPARIRSIVRMMRSCVRLENSGCDPIAREKIQCEPNSC